MEPERLSPPGFMMDEVNNFQDNVIFVSWILTEGVIDDLDAVSRKGF